MNRRSTPVCLPRGGRFLWEHVVSYSRPYADCIEMNFLGEIARGTFEGCVYVYVSEEKPMFLGHTNQRLVLDRHQVCFMSEMRDEGVGEGRVGRAQAIPKKKKQEKEKEAVVVLLLLLHGCRGGGGGGGGGGEGGGGAGAGAGAGIRRCWNSNGRGC